MIRDSILNILKDLNSAKLNLEEESAAIVKKITNLNVDRSLELEKLNIIDKLQYQDINRQKIERAMINLIELYNISEEEIELYDLSIGVKANNIDEGENLSEDELQNIMKTFKMH
jgi:hypothetical protein